MEKKQYVYLFNEGNASMKNLLGGKGANLSEMTILGIPVPQGFTVTTEACNKYYEDDKKISQDIIEEIVGEIRDEYDDEERTYAVLNDHTWVFEAKTQLTDFYKITKIDEETFDEVAGDADTLAGLLLELKGEFPALHEKVTYDYYEFEVLEMDNRRILKVKFTINEPVREGSETEK